MSLYRSVWQILCVLIVVFGLVVPSLLLWVTSRVETGGGETEQTLFRSLSTHDRKPLDYLPETKEASELRLQIRELEEIRASVRDELRVFEQQRSKLGKDIAAHKENLVRVKKDLSAAKIELQETRGKLSKATRDFYDKVEPVAAPVGNIAPIIVLPPQNKLSSLAELKNVPQGSLEDSSFARCTYSLCFQYTSCPLTRPFTVYVYNEANPALFPTHYDNLVSEFVSVLKETGAFSTDPDTACVYVAIVDSAVSAGDLETKVHSLDHWKGDGANHVLVELSSSGDGVSQLEVVRTGRAVVARSAVSPTKPHRPGYDIHLAPTQTAPISWWDVPAILPAFRDVLIYFQGDYQTPKQVSSSAISPADLDSLRKALEDRDLVHMELQCPGSDNSMLENAREGEWALCGGQNSRLALCSQSTFSLVPGPGGVRNGMGTATYTRLVESLMCGSIPILIGIETLPFDDIIDWQSAAITLPPGRFSDTHYILRSFDRESIQEYRLQGRNLWQTYFSSPLILLQATMAIVRYHALHPPPTAPEYAGLVLHSQPGTRKRLLSPVLTQNFTIYSRDFWNRPPGPFFTYLTTPFKPGLVSGSQYVSLGERDIARLPFHIIDGGGITGPNFEDILLGNLPEEQFTVVMLTYQRNQVLLEAVGRLKEVAFLNKVVVVWNNEEELPPEMNWPNIGVPIEVGGV